MEHVVKVPFLRTEWENFIQKTRAETWAPGVAYRLICPDDSEAYCHAEGRMVLTEVSRHKPGRYPERIFYTREWVDPDGRKFGKPALRVCTAEKFRRIAKGWAVDYVIAPEEPPQ